MPVVTPLFRIGKELLRILSYGIDAYQNGYSWIEKHGPPPPAHLIRKLQDKTYTRKLPIYAMQNFCAASLSDAVYAHQQRFLRFAEDGGLPFHALASFGRAEHAQRLNLVEKLVKAVWSPVRLGGVGQ